MSTLSKITAEAVKKPAHTVIVEPWAFADAWQKKPKAAICWGIKLLADADYTTARAEAAKLARQLHPEGGSDQLDAFNDALMRWAVVAAICDPNNREKPAPVIGLCEEDLIREAMTLRGIRFVFDSILKFEVETSPLYLEIDEEGVGELYSLIMSGAPERLSPAAASTARRHMRFALEALRKAPEPVLEAVGRTAGRGR
ncbi:MAG TPA: hypothetical protein VHO25_04800 [Polyangiaceae bacterium]|nr:hypothetical protein [Polyangiaceae bacterium]